MSEGTHGSLRLPRSMRVQQNREFARIKQLGRRLTRGCLIANWIPLPAEATSRIGVITGSRIGSSVMRSRARRLMRETFRLHQHAFQQPVALVLVARPSIVGRGRAEVERDFLSVLQQAGLLKPK